MVTRGDQQEVLIWTDHSKIHNRAGYGVYFGSALILPHLILPHIS